MSGAPLRGYFVAGTDTGVGKTQVARALLRGLSSRGRAPWPLKPAETGCAPDAPEDALALRAACGPARAQLALDRVCPYRFLLPAAPLVAAEEEGRSIDADTALAPLQLASAEGAPVVVEGAGGLWVPFAREGGRVLTNLDLAVRVGLPVVLVGRAGLGTLNHCALSVEALRSRGLALAAIVLNRVSEADDPSVATNARWVAELTGARVLGPGPFVPDAAGRAQALQELIAPLLF